MTAQLESLAPASWLPQRPVLGLLRRRAPCRLVNRLYKLAVGHTQVPCAAFAGYISWCNGAHEYSKNISTSNFFYLYGTYICTYQTAWQCCLCRDCSGCLYAAIQTKICATPEHDRKLANKAYHEEAGTEQCT